MSNSIISSAIRVPFIANLEASMPVIQNGTVQYNKNFVGGAGTSIDILVPSYGNTMGTGADVTGDISDVQNGSRPVTLVQYHKAATLTSVESNLQLGSINDQVLVPFSGKMASDLQGVAIETLKLGAATAFVTTTQKYSDIGEAVANVEASRLNGDIFGVMSPKIAKGVNDSGLSFFQADLKGNFTTGRIGSYLGCEFNKTQDMAGTFSIGAQTLTTPTVTTTYVAGATSLVLGAVSLVGTFKKYQIINVAGVNSVDAYGNDTGIPYAIVLQADVTAAANSITATVQPMYASGPLKNVTALPTATNVFSSAHAVNSTYQTVLVWDKQAFVTATANLKPLKTSVSAPTTGKVLGLMTQIVSDGLKGLDLYRWDCLAGFALIYKSGVSRCDIKVA
jgi:hypothetical protein